jgi:invasion protein IalB
MSRTRLRFLSQCTSAWPWRPLCSFSLCRASCSRIRTTQRMARQERRQAPSARRGQRMARDIRYGDWCKVCFKTPGTSMVCRTSISGTWDTGQPALRADLIERDGESAARLQLFLPVGLYLPAGVKASIDQGTARQIPHVWCLTNTCIAADVADPRLIEDMEAGQKLLLEVVDSNLLTVSTALPLAQFAAVSKIPWTRSSSRMSMNRSRKATDWKRSRNADSSYACPAVTRAIGSISAFAGNGFVR